MRKDHFFSVEKDRQGDLILASEILGRLSRVALMISSC